MSFLMSKLIFHKAQMHYKFVNIIPQKRPGISSAILRTAYIIELAHGFVLLRFAFVTLSVFSGIMWPICLHTSKLLL